jgi:phosphatidylserine/phosphatidylglycerophosphate/cardiolipin synthase-like enzyme
MHHGENHMNPLRKFLILLVLALMLVSVTGVQGCEQIFSEIERILLETPSPAAPLPQTPLAGDWYTLYFTTPRYPDKAEYHTGGIDTKLIPVIEKAKKTLDVCAYQLDLENVAQALVSAKKRGVAVRMVTDTDYVDENAVKILKQGGIKVVDDQRNAIMHNKFLVIDGEWVWAGSWNLTVNCTYRNNNNAQLIHSPELAKNYQTKFNAMFEDGQFGPKRKSGTTTPVLTINGVRVENYFSPEDKISTKLVPLIKTAKKSIHFLAFSFTHEEIGKAMLTQAKNGVEVRGVFENVGSDTKYSEYGAMKQAKLDVLTDGNPYTMHHKVIIIDGEIVVTGSYNFSASADEDNDENLLIFYSPAIASQYEAEFLRVYETAKNPPK